MNTKGVESKSEEISDGVPHQDSRMILNTRPQISKEDDDKKS